MSTTVSRLFVCVLLWGLAAVVSATPPKPKIGILIPLSGSLAAVGVDNRQGVEVGLQVGKELAKAAENPFEVLYEDTRADPKVAVGAFRKLQTIENIIGFYAIRSPVGAALNPISKASKVPFLGGVGLERFPKENDYAFQVWSSSEEEGRKLAEVFIRKRYKRIAVVTTQDEWTSAVTTVFRHSIGDLGSLIFDQEFLPTELDFRTLIAQIKSKQPDAVLVNCTLGQIGPFLKQARDQQLAAEFHSNFWTAKKEVVESAGPENVEGVRFIEMDTSLPVFKTLIKQKFGAVPSGATLSSYASVLFLAQVFGKNPAIDTAEELHAGLGKETELITPDGTWPIKDRRILFPLVERVMKDGRAVSVDP